MNRIDQVFRELKTQGRKGFMPFVCAGHPSGSSTPNILAALADAGASVIELGIPFSDPIADGPVIASAMHEALQSGYTPDNAFAAVRRFRKGAEGKRVGLVAMVSVSIVHKYGPQQFVDTAADSGLDGFIFPDLALEESEELSRIAKSAGLSMSLLIAPTTPDARAAKIARACTGFVYLLARKGITGSAGGSSDAGLRERVKRLRETTELPIACGFGIATAADVRAVVWEAEADAAIVGSALVQKLKGAKDPAAAASAFARKLCTGLVRSNET